MAPNVVAKIREIQAGVKAADRKKSRRAAAQARLDRIKLGQAKRQATQAVLSYLQGGPA